MQHFNQPLDGDMAWNLIPANEVKPILESPFGLKAISENTTYANPNRFFCHWIYREYLISTPVLLQKFAEPIDSVYLACAIAKIVVQISLIFLLAVIITGTKNIRKLDFMIAAVLVTPFFQTNGYGTKMGIIDHSTTFVFFYALPCAILLLYFLPFIFQFYHDRNYTAPVLIKILWIPLALVVCLSGPLNPGVVLIFSMLILLPHVLKNYNHTNQKGIMRRVVDAIVLIPKNYWFFLIPVSLLSIYSLFLGRYNSITIATQIPLLEMYSKLPKGIYNQFISPPGFQILFITILMNIILINQKFKTNKGGKILNIFKWIVVFSIFYVLLLPLGGYRDYRPNILRYDTIMPITLSLLAIFGVSTLFLIKNMSNKQKTWYLPIVATVLFIFTFTDKAEFDKNNCERSALNQIANSKETVVVLEHDCSVVEWKKIYSPEKSELNAQLLSIWRITKEKKRFNHSANN